MIEEKVEKMLDLMITGIEKGSEFVSTESIKFMEELLTYSLFTSYVGLFISTILFLLCLVVLVVNIYRIFTVSCRSKNNDSQCAAAVFGIGLCLIGVFAYISLDNIIKIKVAPRVYAVEYIKINLK